MRFALADIQPSLGPLGVIRRRLLLRQVLGYDQGEPPDAQVSAGEALVLWLAAVLARRRLLSEEQQALLLDEYAGAIKTFGEQLSESLEAQKDPLPVCQLTILDTSWARLSGQKDFLDLRAGTRVGKLVQPPLELLSWDLTSLFVRSWRLLQRPRTRPPQTETT